MENLFKLINPYGGLDRLRVHINPPARHPFKSPPLTSKQKKARNKSKSARKARKNK